MEQHAAEEDDDREGECGDKPFHQFIVSTFGLVPSIILACHPPNTARTANKKKRSLNFIKEKPHAMVCNLDVAYVRTNSVRPTKPRTQIKSAHAKCGITPRTEKESASIVPSGIEITPKGRKPGRR